MLAVHRRNEILDLIQKNQFISVRKLCSILQRSNHPPGFRAARERWCHYTNPWRSHDTGRIEH